MAAIGQPTSETTAAHGQASAAAPGPPQPGGQSNALVVTSQQRAYLDALIGAGMKPSSDLLALSIGSYVCQARTAKQSDKAVWDLVRPLVRNDVRIRRDNSVVAPVGPADPPPATEVDAATSDYIRIATERLC